MNLCWHDGCGRPAQAEPYYHGRRVLTCYKHHPFRARLLALRNLRRLGRRLGVNP